jgi:hypothetical protein
VRSCQYRQSPTLVSGRLRRPLFVVLLTSHSRRAAKLHPTYHGGRKVLDRRCPSLLHGGVRLASQNLQYALDTGLTEGAETPQIRAAYTDSACTNCQCLDDVCAAPKAAVYKHRYSASDGINDLRKRLDR